MKKFKHNTTNRIFEFVGFEKSQFGYYNSVILLNTFTGKIEKFDEKTWAKYFTEIK